MTKRVIRINPLSHRCFIKTKSLSKGAAFSQSLYDNIFLGEGATFYDNIFLGKAQSLYDYISLGKGAAL
jgi:hypothetical protein